MPHKRLGVSILGSVKCLQARDQHEELVFCVQLHRSPGAEVEVDGRPVCLPHRPTAADGVLDTTGISFTRVGKYPEMRSNRDTAAITGVTPAQDLMDADEVVIHDVDRDRMAANGSRASTALVIMT
jgi:hypothetical protein